jgi:superfamily II DNA helicase RecQ
MEQLPIRSSYERTFLNTTHTYFNKYPRDWQLRVGGRIIADICANRETRQLCVQPTGSGKPLLYQSIGTYHKGVTLCLSPLLSLAADQVNKLMISTRGDDASITALHLDECDQSDIREVLELVRNLKDDCTLFLFCSPQSITDKFNDFANL